MRRPIIIEGEEFDWDRGSKAMTHVIADDGEVNWMAAASADPGVTSCPSCKEYYWREGKKVKCKECGCIWEI